MFISKKYSRRRWIGFSAGFIAPLVITNRVIGSRHAPPPSDKITIGMIGCGKMANDYHLRELLKMNDVQIVAVCDVDSTRRMHALNRVQQSYRDAGLPSDCKAYNDFREIISRSDIDAVCIATPDHWHAIPAIEACKAGKDVYCEKPLTLTIAEAHRCIQAARKHHRVFQVGSQQRSNVFGKFREAAEFIQSDRLGKIHRVTVGVGKPSIPCDLPAEEVESGLDWDMWLGQAPYRPYHSSLSPRGTHNHFPQWRLYREFSGGGHTDMGAHHYDIAQWALRLDESGPIKIVPPEDSRSESGVRYIYSSGLEIVHGGPSGCTFYGEKGTLHIDRGKLSSEPAEIAQRPLEESEIHLFKSPGHHRNWIDCIRSRERPVADVEVGARTVTLIHLGNLAYQHQRSFDWDPMKWQFANPIDNSFLDRTRRAPWQLPEV